MVNILKSYMEDILLWTVHQPHPSKKNYTVGLYAKTNMLTNRPVFADVHFRTVARCLQMKRSSTCVSDGKHGSLRPTQEDGSEKISAHEKLVIPNGKNMKCAQKKKKKPNKTLVTFMMFTATLSKQSCSGWLDNGMCFVL